MSGATEISVSIEAHIGPAPVAAILSISPSRALIKTGFSILELVAVDTVNPLTRFRNFLRLLWSLGRSTECQRCKMLVRKTAGVVSFEPEWPFDEIVNCRVDREHQDKLDAILAVWNRPNYFA
jgi:hypothetical protein